jgi:hypothetical protein
VATIPAWPTLGVGHVMTNGDMTAIKAVTDFMMNLSGGAFVGVQTIAQSIGSGADTALTWDTEEFDTDSGHSLVTNTSRYVANTTGKFWVAGVSAFTIGDTSTTTYRVSKIRVNGSAVKAAAATANMNGIIMYVDVGPRLISLTSGDYVEICARHNRGSALNSDVSADGMSWMAVARAGS